MRTLALTIAAALSACTMQQDKTDAQATPAAGPVAVTSTAAAAPQSIEGRWLVERIDGAPPVINIAGYAPVVTIGAERIHFQSQCIYGDWNYARDGERFTASRHFVPGSGMCARGLAPGETAVEAAFDRLERIAHGRDGTLVVEGRGHRLEMRRTELASDGLMGIRNLAGEWRVAGIDGGELSEGYHLALKGNERELWWEPRCAGMARSYRLTGATIQFGPRIAAPPAGGPTAPICTIGLPPRLGDVFRALDAATNIERTGEAGVSISGGGRSLLLLPR
jgi:hypothetical protein